MTSQNAEILERLRKYMEGMYPEWKSKGGFPLKFWELDDPELFYECLSYFPLQIGTNEPLSEICHLPVGFQLAFAIFWLEDDYQFNGWTALTNGSNWLLPRAAEAYRIIGMEEEASALDAAQAALQRDPGNTDAAEEAFNSVNNPYHDENRKTDKILKFFWTHREMFCGGQGADA